VKEEYALKLATFRPHDATGPRIGVLVDDVMVDLNARSGGELPADMIAFLRLGETAMAKARTIARAGGGTAADEYRLDQIELLAPVPRPGKIIHTGCNFQSHLAELTGWKAPEWQMHNWGSFHTEHPTGFLEAPSSVIGDGARVEKPVFTKQLDYEIEIGIVIGREAKNVSVEDAFDYVAGITVFNDLSARDIQAREHANKMVMLGKSFDGSCPLGPYLVTLDELPRDLDLEMRLTVNGEVRQHSSTGHMRFNPAQLVSWWSLTTLEPGDVITSGSPAGVAAGMDTPQWLQSGDTVEAHVAGIGTLTTHIVG